MKGKKITKAVVYHVLVCGLGLVMLYPLIWMFMSSFKETTSIFRTAGSLIPEQFTIANYTNGWRGMGGVSFASFFGNSLLISLTATLGTLASSALVAFGLSRCRFRGKGILHVAMLASMMLPGQILMVPQYLWYQKLGWVGSYAPLIVPYCFAVQGFFVFLFMNFMEGIPRELDEAAKIDGCSYYGIFFRIVLPLVSPALITGAIFSFMWRWDDFMSALLYINDVAKYPVSLALKLFSDPGSSSDFGSMFAMSVLSLVPIVIVFILFQKYLVEGIASTGIKG
ncbi:ABC transporter permease [Anaerolineaceae bacterium oral taxon 439]|nr:ABC transporter permease [Anaerolineaceae bacterium oral taxon 439]